MSFIPYNVTRHSVINSKIIFSLYHSTFLYSLVLLLNIDFSVITNVIYSGTLLCGLELTPAQRPGILLISIPDGQVSLGSYRSVIPVTEIK